MTDAIDNAKCLIIFLFISTNKIFLKAPRKNFPLGDISLVLVLFFSLEWFSRRILGFGMSDDLIEDDSRRMEGKLLVDNFEVGDSSRNNTDRWGLKYLTSIPRLGYKLDILNSMVGNKL